MASVKVKVNSSMAKELLKRMRRLTNKEVHAGFFDSEPHDGPRSDGFTIPELAIQNEYGNYKLKIPSRPFMSESVGDKQKILSILKSVKLSLLRDPINALKVVGSKMEQAIKDSIISGDWEPNRPSTIKKKGSSSPLIDTGQLSESASNRVETKGRNK